MSYCPKCGAPCAEGQSFCSSCGATLAQQNQPQYNQPQYGQPQYGQPQYNQPTLMTPELPMKWFKFIIYFQLFANCVLNAINAISVLTGSHYGYDGEAELVYSYIPSLQSVDMFYGIALLALAVFAIVVRFRLSGYCSNGPTLYFVLLAAQLAVALIYLIAGSAVISDSIVGAYYEPDFGSIIPNMAASAALLACNIKYFSNRKHMFVN